MKLTAIMAVSKDGVVGIKDKDGRLTLPWHLPPDLKRFKALTTGHAIIMGRKTFDSIGRPLPKRTNVVLTRNPVARIPGAGAAVAVCTDVDAALDYARAHDPEPFVIGGPEIWSALWPHVTHVEMTVVDTIVGLGTVFGFHVPLWRETKREPRQEFEGLGYEYVTWERALPDSSLRAPGVTDPKERG